MGYCTNCGQPTDNPNNICTVCSGQSNVSQSSFESNNNQRQEYNNNSMPINLNNEQSQREYWKATFDEPTIAYEQLFKDRKPENDFDLGEYRKKFNIGACLLTTTWLAFNCNFWFALIFIAILMFISSIPVINLLMLPGMIALMIYFGLKGNEIAWKTRPYRDLEHFNKNQKIWSIAGLISFGLFLILILIPIILFSSGFLLNIIHFMHSSNLC